jgi:AhpD family alkylhydroperoxidase
VLPKAFSGIGQLLAAVGDGGAPRLTLELVGLRVRQINGCTACVQGHVEEARKAGASDDQISTVAAWIDSPYFDEDQRVALALADSLIRMADRSDDPVPDDLWAAVTAATTSDRSRRFCCRSARPPASAAQRTRHGQHVWVACGKPLPRVALRLAAQVHARRCGRAVPTSATPTDEAAKALLSFGNPATAIDPERRARVPATWRGWLQCRQWRWWSRRWRRRNRRRRG